ncbi:hypothetical protein N0V91_007465 [Didymella pomorum]|uniref:Uncharacterized protein n=1 Tax=Didymella pomorum TaxID=749634 RepID=A0A9W8Z924_9PLEO|nr:hypothetical protein N0V91_007465 [Didymella pomorum]
MSDSSDPGLSQLDWGKIEKISDMDLKQMLAYQTGFDQENRFNGGFNHIVFMSTIVGARQKYYVVRIPSAGTQERWQKGDAHNIDCEVSLLQYLYQEATMSYR